MLPLYSAVLSSDGLFADLIDLRGLYGAGHLRLTVDRGSVRLSAGAAPDALDVIGDYSVGVSEVSIPLTRWVKVERLTGNSSTILVEILPHTADKRNVTATLSDGKLAMPWYPGGGPYKFEDLLPKHMPVIDPINYSGTIATNGNMSAVYDASKSEIPGHGSIKISTSAAVATTQIRIPIPADQWGRRPKIGGRMHVRIECSDWSKISRLYLQPSSGGGTANGYIFAPINAGISYHGCTNPEFSARWKGVPRTLVFCSDKITAKVGSPADWGLGGPDTENFVPDGFAVQLTTTGAVDLWIHRVYSPRWPVGFVSVIGDGAYKSFRETVGAEFVKRGWNGGVSLYRRFEESGVSYHPTKADLKWFSDNGWDVCQHLADQTVPATPVTFGNTHTIANVLKSGYAQRSYLAAEVGVNAKGLRWAQFLQNGGGALSSGYMADALKAQGINGARARCVDPEFGVDPYNATYQYPFTQDPETTGGWMSGWCSAWGRFNRFPMDWFTTTNTPLARDTFAGSPMQKIIDYCAYNGDGTHSYTHQVVPYDGVNPTSFDSGTNFAAALIASLDAHVKAGRLLVLSPSEVDALTYSRPGPVYMRWDGEWVYRDDPTRIAF